MNFKIIWDKKAQNELTKLDISIAKRIIIKIRELGENPFSKDVKNHTLKCMACQ